MIDKKMIDIEAEIQVSLSILCPNLSMVVRQCVSQMAIFECMGGITYEFAVDRIEWLECPNENAQNHLIRERLLDSLIQTHKQLRIEIERIMYGNR